MMPTDAIREAFAAVAPPELLTSMEEDSGTTYVIDRDSRIVLVNAAWHDFAAANGGERLLRQPIIGTSLQAVIPEVLRPFYDSGIARAFATGEVWQHEYECSSESQARTFRMRVLPLSPLPFAIIANDLIRDEPHAQSTEDASPDAVYTTASGIIVQCANCRRVLRRDGARSWDWVPSFVRTPREHVSHGLCQLCLEYHYRAT